MCVTEHQAAMVLMRKDYNQQVDKLQVMFIFISGVCFLFPRSFVAFSFALFLLLLLLLFLFFFVSFFVAVFLSSVSSILSFRFLFLLFFPFNFISFLINTITFSASFFVSCLLSVCLFFFFFGPPLLSLYLILMKHKFSHQKHRTGSKKMKASGGIEN